MSASSDGVPTTVVSDDTEPLGPLETLDRRMLEKKLARLRRTRGEARDLVSTLGAMTDDEVRELIRTLHAGQRDGDGAALAD